MTDSDNPRPLQWSTSASAKSKSAVQRSVTQLLDELAPERVLNRVGPLKGPVEQTRTPTGCVLQAAEYAVSVSWFAEATEEAALGELHVLVWRGTVTRRGRARPAKGATMVAEFVLRPLEPPEHDCLWQANDGTRYDTASLAARCLALLEGQNRDHLTSRPDPAS